MSPYLGCFLLAVFACSASPISGAEIPEQMTDPSDRATYEWLLERAGKKPHVERKRDGRLEWIGFAEESKYTCSLYLDENGHVIKAMFNKAGFRNDELKRLAGFKHLQGITCSHNFDDQGPNGYRTGPNPMSGAGWIAFKDHPIEFFKIGGCNFDGDGLKAVAKFPHLKELAVFHTRVRDKDLAALEGHPKLEWIYLGPMWDDKITDNALVHLSKVPNLKQLKIVETYLSYEGGFRFLVEGLGDQVEEMELGNTVVPSADLRRLKEELPKAKITQEPIAEIGKLIVENWKGANNKLRKWAPENVIKEYIAAAKQAK